MFWTLRQPGFCRSGGWGRGQGAGGGNDDDDDDVDGRSKSSGVIGVACHVHDGRYLYICCTGIKPSTGAHLEPGRPELESFTYRCGSTSLVVSRFILWYGRFIPSEHGTLARNSFR